MQSSRTVISRLFLVIIFFACATPGTTLQTEYETIQQIYPGNKNIVKVIFKEQTYFVLAEYGKIDKIIKIIETENNNTELWFVLDSNKRLNEVIQYPEMKRYDLTDKEISLKEKSPIVTEKYSAEIDKIRSDLMDDWDPLIEKIKIKLHKVDATSQATP